MNASQRKFLIDKIAERTKQRIGELRESIPEQMSLNVYMLHRVMSNDFQIRSMEELREVVLKKALEAGNKKQFREDWLGNAWGTANHKNVAFTLDEFFVIPEEYLEIRRKNNEERLRIEMQIKDLQLQLESLEVRIMLASDARLQKIINEVDDMGDIALIDSKIKLLS